MKALFILCFSLLLLQLTPFAQEGWFQQTSGTTYYLFGISFTDSDNGTVVGYDWRTGNGIILRTTNGGTSWNLQTSGTTNRFGGVSFTDAYNGTAVGEAGTILRTTNGGTTWISQISGRTETLASVCFTDSSNGTVVSVLGIILRTTDAGKTWIQQTSGTTQDLFGVSFTDSINGTVVGIRGTILRTTDGGANWATQTSGTTSHLMDVFFSDADNGTAVGFEGTILRTTNGGLNWISQTSGKSSWLMSVSFTDSSTGTAVGQNGTILRTTDGGTTWIHQTSGTTQDLFGVSFTDSINGTAVGGWNGTILKTTNGGTTWTFQNFNIPLQIGNMWTYSSQFDTMIESIVDTQSISGNLYYEFDRFRDSTGYLFRMFENKVFLFVDSVEYLWYDFTADSGDTWMAPATPFPPFILVPFFLRDKNAIVTTPIGTFYNCYLFEHFIGSDYEYFEWFAHGIGIVQRDVVTFAGTRRWILVDKFITSVNSEFKINIPNTYILSQNYPNPFNPTTTIKYQIPEISFVTLKVYDILGNEITALVNEEKPAGEYEVEFDGPNLPSGIYFYRLRTGGYVETKKMVLLK